MNLSTFTPSYVLNVGLYRNDNGRKLNAAQVVQWMRANGYDVTGHRTVDVTHQMGKEPTLVVTLGARPTKAALHDLCRSWWQDAVAIVALPSGDGSLVGPRAAAWGAFDPTMFAMPNGGRLMSYGQAPALGARPGAGH